MHARGQIPGRNLVQVSYHRWHQQAKRLGGDRFFSEAFVVFHCITNIFRVFCLEVWRNFVYLQTVGLESMNKAKLLQSIFELHKTVKDGNMEKIFLKNTNLKNHDAGQKDGGDDKILL